MAGRVEEEVVQIRPMGQGGDDIVEVRETEAIGGDPGIGFEAQAGAKRIHGKTPSVGDATRAVRDIDDLDHRKLITWAGLILIFGVTITAVLGFLGITYSTAPSAHEDAVRLLILIIGAVLGTVFGATVVTKGDDV